MKWMWINRDEWNRCEWVRWVGWRRMSMNEREWMWISEWTWMRKMSVNEKDEWMNEWMRRMNECKWIWMDGDEWEWMR